MSGRWRENVFEFVVGFFCLFLQIKHIHNNQQTKENFMDRPVEGLKKIMSCFRAVAPILYFFATLETPLRKWAVTCAFLFSPSIAAFCHFIPLIHSGYLLPSPAKRLQDPLFAATRVLAAASPQRQSSCSSLTSQRCQVPGL